MADVINLQAEDNRNIIDDDAVPTLTLTNTNAAGHGAKIENTNATSGDALDVNSTAGTGIDVDATAGAAIDAEGATVSYFRSSASAAGALQIEHKSTVLASPTVAPFKVVTSTASGPLMDFGAVDSGAVVSTASAGATLSYGVRIKVGDTYGWLPVYIDVA